MNPHHFVSRSCLAAVVAFGLALGDGCYNPNIGPGQQGCSVDGKCPDGLTCFPDKKCYPTGSDPTCAPACGGATPVCDKVKLKCVGCLDDSTCAGATPVCDKASSTCVQCLDDKRCPPGSVCAVAMKVCKPGCNAGKPGCAPDAGSCDVDMGVCRGCGGDDECAGATPRCEVQSGLCVECLPAKDNCAGGKFCDGTTCKSGCKDKASCGVPDGGGGLGVECCARACANLDSDSAHCGACGNACAGGQVCCAGGCKSIATDVAHCGMCGRACSPANVTGPTCVGGACGYTACAMGFGDCDGNKVNGCEIRTATDINHCGGCGKRCAVPPNGQATCTAGMCAVAGCAMGFDDCDKMVGNGCEVAIATDVNNCGACSKPCVGVPNGTPTCVAGVCGGNCNIGFGNCDNNPANGCEINTSNDIRHCGMCNKMCAFPSAAALCVNGGCALGACTMGFSNCDNNPANGCEAATGADVKNCGGCGKACAFPNGVPACVNSVCALNGCMPGYSNCDGNPVNGCEVATGTDINNCGACRAGCPGVPNGMAGCNAGVCGVGACNMGWGNCDNMAGNGCESNLNFDAKNCAACARTCNVGNTCTKGACAIGTPVRPAGTYGPLHTFVGITADHYITQGACSISPGGQGDADDAWYFCSHFYGPNCYPQAGFVKHTVPMPASPKMHKQGGCTGQGLDIPGAVCEAGACKIGNWSEITSGLANLICKCQ